jgi:hypothetical protein
MLGSAASPIYAERPKGGVGECQLVAGNVSSRSSLTAGLGRPGPRVESQLPGVFCELTVLRHVGGL